MEVFMVQPARNHKVNDVEFSFLFNTWIIWGQFHDSGVKTLLSRASCRFLESLRFHPQLFAVTRIIASISIKPTKVGVYNTIEELFGRREDKWGCIDHLRVRLPPPPMLSHSCWNVICLKGNSPSLPKLIALNITSPSPVRGIFWHSNLHARFTE